MAGSHNHYLPKGVTVHTKRLGHKNWAWRVCDFFYCEIEKGDGCKTKAEAHGEAMKVKRTYLKNLVVHHVSIALDTGKRKKRR